MARTKKQFNALVKGFLTTIRRVPAEIVLGTAACDLELDDSQQCLVGTFVRAEIANMVEKDIADTTKYDAVDGYGLVSKMASRRFGGTVNEWAKLFYGVVGYSAQGLYASDDLRAATELAFVRRVNEVVRA